MGRGISVAMLQLIVSVILAGSFVFFPLESPDRTVLISPAQEIVPEQSLPAQQHVLSEPGLRMVHLEVMDEAGLVDVGSAGVLVFDDVKDAAAPVTTCEIEGEAVNGWYVVPPLMTLRVDEYPWSNCTTYYSIHYGMWHTYVGPVELTDQGYIPISYYSVDSEGNAEFTKYLTIQVDYSPPEISHLEVHTKGFVGRTASVSWYVYDYYSFYALSVFLSLDGGDEIAVPEYSEGYDFSGLSEGTHTLVLRVVDDAWNFATEEVEFEVVSFSMNTPLGALLMAMVISAAIAVPILLYLRRKSALD